MSESIGYGSVCLLVCRTPFSRVEPGPVHFRCTWVSSGEGVGRWTPQYVRVLDLEQLEIFLALSFLVVSRLVVTLDVLVYSGVVVRGWTPVPAAEATQNLFGLLQSV